MLIIIPEARTERSSDIIWQRGQWGAGRYMRTKCSGGDSAGKIFCFVFSRLSPGGGAAAMLHLRSIAPHSIFAGGQGMSGRPAEL
jgi:hypothetical protein